MNKGDDVLEQINGEGYSTTSGSVKLKDIDEKSKNARAGLIDIPSGCPDPTGGATDWDGIDFIQKGISHNKFIEYSAVKISESHFDAYQLAQSRAYGTSTHGNFNKSCTPIVLVVIGDGEIIRLLMLDLKNLINLLQ